jgi:hypothetical protein
MKIIYESLEKFVPWSGAVSTYQRIEEAGKLEQLESTLEDLYPGGMTETELNDLLWFDEDSVFEWLGIEPEDGETDEQEGDD